MSELEYWERQPTDQPWLLNGFNGTWNFRDHNLIPESLHNFIFEHFPKVEKFKRIPLEDINKIMNDVWEGPGSMTKIVRLKNEMFSARQDTKKENSSKVINTVRTIDDYDENDFSEKVVITKEDEK